MTTSIEILSALETVVALENKGMMSSILIPTARTIAEEDIDKAITKIPFCKHYADKHETGATSR